MTGHRRLVLELGFAAGLALTLLLTLALAARESAAAAVRADTVRLHVLANSDTVEDQVLKLRVRDAVLAALPDALGTAQNQSQAVGALRAHLPALQRAAADALRAAHSGQTAAVRLETQDFAAQDYGGFALPGGTYTALRVELGAAQGHNWFCVLYPALCVPGAAKEYPTTPENALVFGEYELRSALWDGLKKALP